MLFLYLSFNFCALKFFSHAKRSKLQRIRLLILANLVFFSFFFFFDSSQSKNVDSQGAIIMCVACVCVCVCACVCVSSENLRVLLSCHSEEDDILFLQLLFMLNSFSVALAASFNLFRKKRVCDFLGRSLQLTG